MMVEKRTPDLIARTRAFSLAAILRISSSVKLSLGMVCASSLKKHG